MVLATDRLVGCRMHPGDGDQPGGNPQSYRPSLVLPKSDPLYFVNYCSLLKITKFFL